MSLHVEEHVTAALPWHVWKTVFSELAQTIGAGQLQKPETHVGMPAEMSHWGCGAVHAAAGAHVHAPLRHWTLFAPVQVAVRLVGLPVQVGAGTEQPVVAAAHAQVEPVHVTVWPAGQLP
jgi:hypothetical protein